MKRFVVLALALGACGGDDPCDPDAPNTICTIAGNGDQGFNNIENGPALKSAFYIPQDTIMLPDGDIWVLDFNNYLVRAISPDGNIRTVLGNGQLADSPPPNVATIPALQAGFNHTTNLFYHDGYVYLAAWHNSRIKRVRLADMLLENYAGLGARVKYTGDGGQALEADLDLPSSIALDPQGDIVIMDQANQVVRRIDQNGVITRVAGKCVVDLEFPCASGVQPVACPDNNKYACGDLATECAKPCTPGYGGDGGSALEARLGQPYGQQADPAGRMVFDSKGNLIFADTDNNRVRKVDPAGIITTIAGTGEEGYSGDGGPATAAKLYRPVDVALMADDSVMFTDVFNNCVRKVSPDGTISRVVGTCSDNFDDRGFSGDGGDPLKAKLDRPYGIDLVGTKLYVSDSYNNRIRVVNLQ
jgi:DNA-binding beta-propeller fold protein YncE